MSFTAVQVKKENEGALAITMLSASDDSLDVSGLMTRALIFASSPGNDCTGITTVLCREFIVSSTSKLGPSLDGRISVLSSGVVISVTSFTLGLSISFCCVLVLLGLSFSAISAILDQFPLLSRSLFLLAFWLSGRISISVS